MLALLVMLAQAEPTAPPPPPPAEYQAPPVRPFEPTGAAPQAAQGAEAPAPVRRPLDAPVAVDAYRGHYEQTPTDRELAYDQGVAQAEISMDARMGPLDGGWRVVDADGAALFTLILGDDGSGAMVEGAWRDPRGKTGVAASVSRDAAGVVLILDDRCELRLTPAPDGYVGVLISDGRQQPVRLDRL